MFFPHLHHSFNLRDAEVSKVESAEERKKRLEAFVKEKFTKTWVSVKKAFLDLDADHDGFITHEDLIRYFRAGEEGFLYEDLRTLLMQKDFSGSQGRLNYKDFSRWVGNYIHSVQGFYFRHDSKANPAFERLRLKYANSVGRFKETISRDLIKQEDVIATVLDKITFQWKTIRKSFHDLSKDKTGGIEAPELRHYLDHWGIPIEDATFKKLYELLDHDGDGKVSYADFQRTVGSKIHPGEGLYFRQDVPDSFKISSCD